MSAPLDFVRIFAAHLRQADIGCAITSGMACVHYGLQQITKDTDWIIPADDLAKLRELFARLQGALPPWRVSYRQICGAPLEAEFMANGWTSHLSIWDSAGSVEHKVDLFSRPPRVRPEDMSADAEGWASQHVVAQMKKTDRDKDWPIVDGLGRRMWGARLPAGLLHMTRLEDLQAAWTALNEKTRLGLAERRPLLKCLARSPPPTRGQSDLLLLLERLVWQRVNKQRYGHYVRAWKEFYRRWRQEEDWVWPTDEPFAPQHQRLRQAAAQHGLPPDPLAATPRDALVQSAVAEILAMERFTAQDIAAVMPPVYELLP